MSSLPHFLSTVIWNYPFLSSVPHFGVANLQSLSQIRVPAHYPFSLLGVPLPPDQELSITSRFWPLFSARKSWDTLVKIKSDWLQYGLAKKSITDKFNDNHHEYTGREIIFCNNYRNKTDRQTDRQTDRYTQTHTHTDTHTHTYMKEWQK